MLFVNYKNGKYEGINIAYIGGGSMDFGWKFFSELAAEELYATVNLYDRDKQLSLTNEVIGNKLRENPECKSDIIFLASDTPEEALKSADIVIMSISPGDLEESVAELTLPEAYGIYQSTGEQAGPASIIRALKTLPEYIKYAELIKRYNGSNYGIFRRVSILNGKKLRGYYCAGQDYISETRYVCQLLRKG